jgi:hypothetical protein
MKNNLRILNIYSEVLTIRKCFTVLYNSEKILMFSEIKVFEIIFRAKNYYNLLNNLRTKLLKNVLRFESS